MKSIECVTFDSRFVSAINRCWGQWGEQNYGEFIWKICTLLWNVYQHPCDKIISKLLFVLTLNNSLVILLAIVENRGCKNTESVT
jgi:hypothetical protein